MTQRLTILAIGLAFASVMLVLDRVITGVVQCRAVQQEGCPR